MQDKPDDGIHMVVSITQGEFHITQHTAQSCPVHGKGNATGKSFTGAGEAFRTGWDEYITRSRKASLN